MTNGFPACISDGRRVMCRSPRGLTVQESDGRVPFEQRYAFGAGITIANFDVSLDGQEFIMVKDESSAGRLNVVLNWFSELERLATATRTIN